MKLAEAYVEIKADTKPFVSTMGQMRGKVEQMGERMGAAFSRAFGRALRIGWRYAKWGLAAFIGALGTSIHLAAKQEEADIALAESLRQIGKYSDIAFRDLKAFAAEMQNLTTYGDEAVQEMMSMGVVLGKLSGEKLKEASRMAIGLAEILKVDLKSAMQLVARAAQGQYQLFSRYGIRLDKLRTNQEKWNKVMALANQGFAVHQERTQKLHGQLAQLRNVVGDLGEKVGLKLLPGMTSTVVKIKEWVRANDTLIAQKFGEWVDKTRDVMKRIPVWWEQEGKRIFTDIYTGLSAMVKGMVGLHTWLSKFTDIPAEREGVRAPQTRLEEMLRVRAELVQDAADAEKREAETRKKLAANLEREQVYAQRERWFARDFAGVWPGALSGEAIFAESRKLQEEAVQRRRESEIARNRVARIDAEIAKEKESETAHRQEFLKGEARFAADMAARRRTGLWNIELMRGGLGRLAPALPAFAEPLLRAMGGREKPIPAVTAPSAPLAPQISRMPPIQPAEIVAGKKQGDKAEAYLKQIAENTEGLRELKKYPDPRVYKPAHGETYANKTEAFYAE